jgi:hypothetical protein
MGKVIDFPLVTSMKNNLDSVLDHLHETYEAQAQLEGAMYMVEEKQIRLEVEYAKYLTEYVRCMGVENVEVKYLQYGNVEIEAMEDGSIKFTSYPIEE